MLPIRHGTLSGIELLRQILRDMPRPSYSVTWLVGLFYGIGDYKGFGDKDIGVTAAQKKRI